MKNASLAYALIAVVTATAAFGLWTIGSPSAERARVIDRQRLNDLQMISNGVDMYWTQQEKLPTSLEELQRTRNIQINGITDPETKTLYEFSTKDAETYVLCATFTFPTSPNDPPELMYARYPYSSPTDRGPSFWNHAAGKSCFTINVIKPPVVK